MEENIKKKMMEIDPDIIKAITEQVKAQIGASPNESSKKPIIIGPFKLTPLNPNLSFKTKEVIHPEQQVLIDYCWNARNKAQLTMALHAFSYYLNSKNKPQKALPNESTSLKSLAPEPPPTQLLAFIRELEYSNTELRMKIEKLEGVEKENKKLKKEILRKEKEEEEAWGKWREFPQKINEIKKEVLEIVTKDYATEQVFYQEVFRRLGTRKALFDGITITAETYEDGVSNMKGFSYLMCNINLGEWKDIKIDNTEVTISRLFKLGLINRLYVTAKKDLVKIEIEKLMLNLASMMENKQTVIECEFQTIPPAFRPGEISSAKSYVTLRRVPVPTMKHVVLDPEELVSENYHSIEDQIIQYRAMMINKPYNIPAEYELVGEDRDNKIYSRDFVSDLRGAYQFSGLNVKNIKEAHYYNQVRAYYMTRRQGDIWGHHENTTSASETADYNNEDHDETTEANIINSMEG